MLASSRPAGFDPVSGYSRKERNLDDPRVREGIKEIAQMDGAIIVSADGVVEAAALPRLLRRRRDLEKGLGARQWAAAAISRTTNAVAVTVSQSNGTVRLFQNGEVVLRIEPYSAARWVGESSNTSRRAPKQGPSRRPTERRLGYSAPLHHQIDLETQVRLAHAHHRSRTDFETSQSSDCSIKEHFHKVPVRMTSAGS